MTDAVELALSSGGRPSLVALRTSSGCEAFEVEGRGTATTEAVATACQRAGIEARDIRAVRVEVGPGSFTGLRTAVVTARTAAELGGARLCAFTRFELLAVAALRESDDEARVFAEPMTFVLDARRGRVHRGLVALQDGIARVIEPPCAVRIEEFDTEGTGLVFLDASLDAESLGVPSERVRELPTPIPDDLFDRRLLPEEKPSNEVLPLYLMGSTIDE